MDQEQRIVIDAAEHGWWGFTLPKNAADLKSGASQYFTPRALIRAIVEVARPGPRRPSTMLPAGRAVC